ncbi:hypothetical protein LCGC14_2679610, partial [marine sediment metagenome]
MTTAEFLKAIFSEAIDSEHQLSIFGLPSRAIKRFTNIDEAVAYIARQSENVYFGLGLIKGNPPGRGKLKDISAICSLWADIDVAGSEHSKPNLPLSIEEARALLTQIPLKPSILVHSGGGLHPHWIFKEPWLLDTEAERAAAATLSRRLAGTLRNAAAGGGMDLDNTGALTQVLRPPETLNRKYDPPIKVQALEQTDLRYLPDDFEDILLDDKLCQVSQVVEIGDIVLKTGAEPPGTKFAALMENDPKFKKSWKRARPDLQDQSASAYCCSLASIAAAAGWTDQEIA